MLLSQYFIPLLKEDPLEATISSHKLMIRAGLIRQQNSGLYVWLPMGLKVLRKIENTVRQGMDKYGAIETLMPCVQPATLWHDSGRYNAYGAEMLRFKDRHQNELLFGPTNEEVITEIFKNNIKSYKELPKNFYQIQWKFRDEIRPRFGLLRGREFLLKDAYSFDLDEESAIASYDNMFAAYIEIFKAMSLKVVPVRAKTGAIGGDLSHEFHVIAETGESDIFYDPEIELEIDQAKPDVAKLKKMYAVADDMFQEEQCPIAKEKLRKHKSIEVGHIFYLATKYTEAMNCKIMNDKGVLIHPHGGCYGIGVSRLVAAVIEASHDNKGIVWPKSITPFHASMINLGDRNPDCINACNHLYKQLSELGFDILYDDTQTSSGQKFASHDLIGLPLQIIVGPKSLTNNTIEVKTRADHATAAVKLSDVVDFFREFYS